MAMLPDMLKRNRERWGMGVGEAGWRLGITRREYVAIEEGERPPNAGEYAAILRRRNSPGDAHSVER